MLLSDFYTFLSKWNLRDQGYGGGDLQMVSLQSSRGLGFFAATKQVSLTGQKMYYFFSSNLIFDTL